MVLRRGFMKSLPALVALAVVLALSGCTGLSGPKVVKVDSDAEDFTHGASAVDEGGSPAAADDDAHMTSATLADDAQVVVGGETMTKKEADASAKMQAEELKSLMEDLEGLGDAADGLDTNIDL